MVNIFAEAKESVMPSWAKFVNKGDTVQGTYVGKLTGVISTKWNNEQIVYQLQAEDGTITNVGFGLNKKSIHSGMDNVKFGQVIGFRYNGEIEIKGRAGVTKVKDYSLFQDPKIVDAKWMAENAGNMPTETKVAASTPENTLAPARDFGAFEDVPFSSSESLTNADKLAVIEKLAKDKIGVSEGQSVKDRVMEVLQIAFIPIQYDAIIAALSNYNEPR